MCTKKLLSIVLLFIPIIAVSDNTNLTAEMEVGRTDSDGYVYNPRPMSCQELVDLRYEEFVTRRKEHTTNQAEYFLKQAEFLFPNDEKPNCGEDVLPKEWIKNTTKINDYATTKCRESCNFRYQPTVYPTDMKNTTVMHTAGRIEGNQKIFLDEYIEAYEYSNFIARPRYYEPNSAQKSQAYWYRFWYTFIYEGKKYYIHEDNITLNE